MKAIFHVGPHKTGTTSLQHFLSDNAPALLERGVYVPTVKSLDGSPNHWYLVYIASSSDERSATYHNSVRGKHTPEQCNAFRRQYGQALRHSLEQARELEKGRGQELAFTISTEEVAFLTQEENNNLYKIFLEYCDTVEIPYYYRSPIDRLRSDLQQGSKGGHIFRPALLKDLPCQDTARVKKFIPEAGLEEKVSIRIRPYMRCLSDHKDWDVRRDFCDVLGVSPEALHFPGKDPGANESISLQMFSILQHVNRIMPTVTPNGNFNDLKRYFHDAVEAYRWTPEDTPFRLAQADIDELLKSRERMQGFLAMGNHEKTITFHPDCRRIFESIASTAAEPNVDGSIFEHVPAMSHTYYTNALCHFWSYLQRAKNAVPPSPPQL